MDQKTAMRIAQEVGTIEECDYWIDTFEDHCDLQCPAVAPACNVCDFPSVIAILKRRKKEFENEQP